MTILNSSKKYITLFRMRFISGLQYRAAALAGISTQFAWGFLNILLYRAFYESNPNAFPMEFNQLSAYIWLGQAFLALFNMWYYDRDILDMITDGNIAYELVRPVDLYTFWFTRVVSVRISRAVLRCLPILIIASLLPTPYGITLPSNPANAVFFIFSMFFAMICVTSFSMLIYIACFHTVNSLGVRLVAQTTADFLSGGIIPLPFMPAKMARFLELTPFGAMQNLPFRIYSGNISGIDMIKFFVLQIFWCIILIIIGKLWMKSSLKKVVVQGG